MKFTVAGKIVPFLVVLVLGSIGFGSSSLLAQQGQETVQVTLRTGEVKTLDAASFELDWVFPVTVMEEDTCEERVIKIDEIKDIFPISLSWSECEKKEDWLFEVDLRDGNYVQGHLKGESRGAAQARTGSNEPFVRGRDPKSGKEEMISYKNIKKISFVKSN